MNTINLPARLALVVLIVALGAISGSGAVREYLFSGPSITGRFIVEEYTRLTPIDPAGEDLLVTNFFGAPYLFSATVGDWSYTTTNFELVVRNNFVAFGRSDVYGLQDSNFGLKLMGPSVGNPYTSTLPHELEAYSGLHVVGIHNPETGELIESEIDSLVAVPVLSIERSPPGLKLRWPVSSPEFVLEASTSLSPAAAWSMVTEKVETVRDSFSVTIAADAPARFFRLRWSQ